MSNVIPFRGRPWQPTLTRPVPDPPDAVILTVLEAQLIATLLTTLRSHAPAVGAIDKAVQLLTPGRPT